MTPQDGLAWREHDVKKSQVLQRNSRTGEGSKVMMEYINKILDKNVESGNLKDDDELMQERFSLMRERISEIQKEELVGEPYRDFFRKTGDFILEICRIHDRIREGWLEKASMEELKENNHKMYEDILPEHYEESYESVLCLENPGQGLWTAPQFPLHRSKRDDRLRL